MTAADYPSDGFDAQAAAARLLEIVDSGDSTWQEVRDAALAGDPAAMGWLGLALYQHGSLQKELDSFVTGLSWICRAADAGNEHAKLAVQGMEIEFDPEHMAAIRKMAAEPIQ